MPVSFKVLARFQQNDRNLQNTVARDSTLSRKTFHGGYQLICKGDKIYVPSQLRKHVVKWYHEYLCHPGETRTEETINQHLYIPGIRSLIKDIVGRCPICQTGKKKRIKYGHLPAKVAESYPWEHLCVDTIGPYIIRRKGKKELHFQAVTMIDPATGWFEMKQTKTKQADEVANHIETQWLSRYPWPQQITFDAGPEFKAEFQKLIKEEYDIDAKPSSKRNPQANAVLERVHGTIGNMMRTFEVDNIDLDEEDPFIGMISAICFAVRSTYHTTLQATPGQLVFGRDMIFHIETVADWQHIHNRKQALINKNNQRENAKRHEHDYAVGDRVLINVADHHKMERPRAGPYSIVRTHTNGTVTIQKGAVTERLNIRQIVPFQD